MGIAIILQLCFLYMKQPLFNYSDSTDLLEEFLFNPKYGRGIEQWGSMLFYKTHCFAGYALALDMTAREIQSQAKVRMV